MPTSPPRHYHAHQVASSIPRQQCQSHWGLPPTLPPQTAMPIPPGLPPTLPPQTATEIPVSAICGTVSTVPIFHFHSCHAPPLASSSYTAVPIPPAPATHPATLWN